MYSLKDFPIPYPTYLSREEIRAIEENEFDSGVTSYELMQNAGLVISDKIKELFTENEILILAGNGNNGGDASIAATHLIPKYKVTLIYLKKPKSKEAVSAMHEANKIDSFILGETVTLEDTLLKIENAKIILDGIFGTGLKVNVRTPENLILEAFSKTDAKILSIDIPSGLDCNTGKWLCKPYSTEYIFSLQFSKNGFKTLDENVKIEILNIGIKPQSYSYVTSRYIKNYWPIRDEESHKGQNGRVMVIGGSDEFTGAPVLSGMAAMRTGIDTLRIAVPETIRNIVAGYKEDFIVVKVNGARITSKSFKKYNEMALNRHDVITMGMGLSNHPDCNKFVREFFAYGKERVKFVLDAEAIRAFKNEHDLLKNSNTIITPHKREFRMLMNEDFPVDLPNLIEYAQSKAKELGIVILLKGKTDIITNGYRTLLNQTGHSGMTVGGSGDVLAGVVAACHNFIDDPLIAAAVAAHIMGLAGEKSAKKYGYSLIASDIIVEIPKVLMETGVNY